MNIEHTTEIAKEFYREINTPFGLLFISLIVASIYRTLRRKQLLSKNIFPGMQTIYSTTLYVATGEKNPKTGNEFFKQYIVSLDHVNIGDVFHEVIRRRAMGLMRRAVNACTEDQPIVFKELYKQNFNKIPREIIIKNWINYFSTSAGNKRITHNFKPKGKQDFDSGFIVMVNQRGRQDEPIRVLHIQETLLDGPFPDFDDVLFPVFEKDQKSGRPIETWVHNPEHINARRWQVNNLIIKELKTNLDLFSDTRIRIVCSKK